MKQTQAGIRELKAHLSAYLRQVKSGRTITITERGNPIGQIVPVAQPIKKKLERLAQAGIVSWSGKAPAHMKPVAESKGDRTVSDLVLEDRE